MSYNRVKFVFYKPLPVSTLMVDAFQYKPEVGYAWLQRIIFKFLTWIKAFAIRKDLDYKEIQFDKKDLLEQLFMQKHIIHKMYYNEKPQFLIGKGEFFELINITRNKYPEFDIPISISLQDEYGKNNAFNAFGVELIVIPWMEGMIILPPGNAIKFLR